MAKRTRRPPPSRPSPRPISARRHRDDARSNRLCGVLTSSRNSRRERSQQSRYEGQAFIDTARQRWRKRAMRSGTPQGDARRPPVLQLRAVARGIKLDRVLDGRPCRRSAAAIRAPGPNQARQQRPSIQYARSITAPTPTPRKSWGIAASNGSQRDGHNTAGDRSSWAAGGSACARTGSHRTADRKSSSSPEDPFTVPRRRGRQTSGSDARLSDRACRGTYRVRYPEGRTLVHDRLDEHRRRKTTEWVKKPACWSPVYIEMVGAELASTRPTSAGATNRSSSPLHRRTCRPADTSPVNGDRRASRFSQRQTVKRQLKWATINGVKS